MEDTAGTMRLFDRCLNDAIEARRKQSVIASPFPGEVNVEYNEPWPIYQEFYDGLHWKRMGRMPKWKSAPVDNIGFVVVQSNTTFLCDNKPKVEYLPVSEDDDERAAVVNAGFTYWWDKFGYNVTDAMAVMDSRKFGVGWLTLKWDSDKKRQRLDCVHPENIYVDPDCTADSYFSEGPTYLIYEYMAQIGDIKAQYPDVDEKALHNRKEAKGNFFERIRQSFAMGTDYPSNPAASVPVYELWIRDPERVEWDEDFGDDVLTLTKKKYPGGRVITIAGDQVLDDRPNPYKHGLFPFMPVHCYPESGKFYSASDIKNLLGPMVMVDRYNQLLFDTTIKSGGGVILVNPFAGLHADQITNDPVQVREVRDVNTAMRIQQFPAPSRHMMDHINVLKSAADDMAGLHDFSKGRPVPGNKTANEVSLIFESDKTRTRQAARWHARAIHGIGQMWLANARQFGDFKWIVRIAGEDGKENRVEFTKAMLKDLELDLQVADFAQLPDRQQERKNLAMELYGTQVIDAEELLKTIDWPNYQAVLARQAKAMEAAAAAKGAPAGGEMPPELAAMMGGAAPEGAGPEAAPPAPEEMPMEQMPEEVPPELMELLGQQQGMEATPEVPEGIDPEAFMEIIAAIQGGADESVIQGLIERLAQEEGLTVEELLDEMVPDEPLDREDEMAY